MEKITLKTTMCTFTGIRHENAYEFLAVPYGRAGRFEYCELINSYGEVFDALNCILLQLFLFCCSTNLSQILDLKVVFKFKCKSITSLNSFSNTM